MNYVDSHDGFTLYDLVSYGRKRNWQTGLAFSLHGASQSDDDIYVMINAYWEELEFHVQKGTAQEWKRIVDTALPSPDDFSDRGLPLERARYVLAPRSIVVLLRPRTGGRKS